MPQPQRKRRMVNEESESTPKPNGRSVMPAGDVNWNDLLDQFQTEGFALYLKDRLRVRLLPFSDPQNIFIPVSSFYRGKERTKYMVPVWDITNGVDNTNIRGLILTARTVRSIITQAAEGWDLFDKEEGYGLSLIKTGSGQNVSINITISPKPLAVPDNVMEAYEELDIEEEAAKWSKSQKDRATGAAAEVDDEDEGSSEGGWN